MKKKCRRKVMVKGWFISSSIMTEPMFCSNPHALISQVNIIAGLLKNEEWLTVTRATVDKSSLGYEMGIEELLK